MPMRKPFLVLTLPLLLAAAPATDPAFDGPFTFLHHFSSAHYLTAAIDLQKLSPADRTTQLQKIAADLHAQTDLYILCRMLFQPKPNQPFRRPGLGAPHFVAGLTLNTVPLEPIALQDGVPILIVQGYILGGQAEHPSAYLDYCLNSCDWTTTTFAPKSADDIQKAIDAFIATLPANPANAHAYDFLRRQADPPATPAAR